MQQQDFGHNQQTGYGLDAGRATEINEGLRKHMLRIYNIMGIGLALTALVAMVIGSNDAMFQSLISNNMLWYGALFSPLLIVMVMSFGSNKLSVAALGVLFAAYAALVGVSMSAIVYGLGQGALQGSDVMSAFFITAGTFGGMSLVGYTTKKDLSGMGGFFMFAIIGLIVASLVNFFILQSGMFAFILSAVTILLFAGLIAYYTQEAKQQYLAGFDSQTTTKLALMSALGLYIAVVAIFRNLVFLFASSD
ncbi:MAG: Bax inhibitor-1/YccA family protein [Alphaproteobacteria bacterium]